MAGTNYGSTYVELSGTTSPASGTAPTTVADGQPAKGLASITVVVSSASGTTLSGAGTLQAYVYDDFLARWIRFAPADLTVTASSVRDQMFAPVSVITPRNQRIVWIPSGVTFSAGSAGITVTQLGESYTDLVVNQGNAGVR